MMRVILVKKKKEQKKIRIACSCLHIWFAGAAPPTCSWLRRSRQSPSRLLICCWYSNILKDKDSAQTDTTPNLLCFPRSLSLSPWHPHKHPHNSINLQIPTWPRCSEFLCPSAESGCWVRSRSEPAADKAKQILLIIKTPQTRSHSCSKFWLDDECSQIQTFDKVQIFVHCTNHYKTSSAPPWLSQMIHLFLG